MVNPYRFYTYAYLREDRTPYYIGKGTGRRYSSRRSTDIKPPKDKSRVIFLKQNLTEEEAFKHEKYMIAVFGRKDLGTGILHNRTDGGDGAGGAIKSIETRKRISQSLIGKKHSEKTKKKISDTIKKNENLLEHIENLKKINIGNNYNLGRKISEETKLKLRELNVNYWKITFDNGKILEGKISIREICKKYGYDKKSIYNVMKGKVKKHKDIVAVEKLDTTP